MQITLSYAHREDLYQDLDLEGLVRFVLGQESCAPNTEVSLSFVDNQTIHELNKTYRGIDRPTDVLSFECDTVPFEGELFSPEAEYELGDIIIASDVALAQTHEFGTTFEEEITLLVVHGLLHLLGYDHVEDKEAEVMEAKQAALIHAWNGLS